MTSALKVAQAQSRHLCQNNYVNCHPDQWPLAAVQKNPVQEKLQNSTEK